MTTSFEAHEDAGSAAWYHDAVIYEVHVRAFADANGDGIGDFRGLTSSLDYLRDLGVTTLWLLPFYPRRSAMTATTSPTTSRSIPRTGPWPTSVSFFGRRTSGT